jgi:hypothetical protein
MDQQARDAQEEIGEGTRNRWVSQLSPAQIAGGAVAAVSAAVAGSALGVHGTVIGAGIASVVVTVVTTFATSSLKRGGQLVQPGLRRVRVVRDEPRISPKQWRTIGLSAAATMLVALVALTTFELIAGSPVSGLTGGDTGGSRTSLGALAGTSDDSSAGTPDTTTESPSEDANGVQDGEQRPSTVDDESTPLTEPTEPVATAKPTAEPVETEPAPTPEPSVTSTSSPAPTTAPPAE